MEVDNNKIIHLYMLDECKQKQVNKKNEADLIHRLLDENRELREKCDNERRTFYKTMKLYEDEIQTLERKIQSCLRTFGSIEIVHTDGTVDKLDLNGNIVERHSLDQKELDAHINEEECEIYILTIGKGCSLAFKSREELEAYIIQHNINSSDINVMCGALMR